MPEGAAEADADGQKVYQITQAGWEELGRWRRMAPLRTRPSGVRRAAGQNSGSA